MTAGAPWSVKGIDPKAREVAKDLARRSGMTLGEWLNRVILEDDAPDDLMPPPEFAARSQRGYETPKPPVPLSTPAQSPRVDELGRVVAALDRLTQRIETSETRTGLAISGVEHSVRQVTARIETAERDHFAVASRQDAGTERLEAEQARIAERLRRLEAETSGPRSADALRAIEARLARVESSQGGDATVLVDEVVTRLGNRLAEAETRTARALEGLRLSMAELDGRIRSVEGVSRADLEPRLEELAERLTRRVDDARSEMAARLAASGSERVEARIGELAQQVGAVEARSARAIERMGREVLAMAEVVNRRVQAAEQRSAEAIEQVGGEVSRIAGAVEDRLGRMDRTHAEALERLGGEIGRITERLTERMTHSERRAAQAIDDVGEQVSRLTERIEQRHERASSDLAERIRQSEERTARLLAEAQARIDARLGEVRSAPRREEPDFPTVAAPFVPDLLSRAEPVATPALDPERPAFGAEDFDAADRFAPIPEPEDDGFGLEQPPPPPEDLAPLTTREVIDQARAAARAAGAPRGPTLKAAERRPAQPRRGGGLFAALKPGRPTSTWQTALMIAGGAAFLSVGAAGVVLMEGHGAAQEASLEATQFAAPPRAAVALASEPLGLSAPAADVEETPTAETGLGDYMAVVRAIEQREPGALARLKAIAESGQAPAQLYLARLYEAGQAGVVQNLGEARRWTARAAEAGDPSAMHNLALYSFRGEGGALDTATAAQWFRKAAERGVVDSQYNLGLLYQSGSGVERDPVEAYKWFAIAANGGDGQARTTAMALADRLPADQLAAAQRAAGAFQPLAQPEAPATTGSAAGSGMALASAQRVLMRLGYYKGLSASAPPHELKLAVAAYQRDHGLPATGSLDGATVSRLSVFTR